MAQGLRYASDLVGSLGVPEKGAWRKQVMKVKGKVVTPNIAGEYKIRINNNR